jgi:hypothetical protein
VHLTRNFIWLDQVNAITKIYLQWLKENWLYILLLVISPPVSAIISKSGYSSSQFPATVPIGVLPMNLFLGLFSLMILAMYMPSDVKASKKYLMYLRLGLYDSAFWFSTLMILLAFVGLSSVSSAITLKYVGFQELDNIPLHSVDQFAIWIGLLACQYWIVFWIDYIF